MIRAVLFDFDDTLVDFVRPPDARALIRGGAERCYAYLTAHGLPMPSFETFLRRQRWQRWTTQWADRLTGAEPDGRHALRRLCREFGLQRDESSLAKLGWLWYEPLTECARVADDVVPTLSSLRDQDIALGLVVNTPHLGAVIDQHLTELSLIDFFPVRSYSSEVGARKPDAHVYTSALEELGVSATDALFVGNDLKTDIVGARRLGMKTVLRMKRPATRRERQLSDHVILRLEELLPILDLPTSPAPRSSPIPPLQLHDVPVGAK